MAGSGTCTICCKKSFAVHLHHVIPQSCGGTNLATVLLCGQCHTTLHSAANHILACVRRNKIIKKQFWNLVEDETRAQPLLTALVNALYQHSTTTVDTDHEFVLTVKFPTLLYQQLKLIQRELGATSLQQTLHLCVLQAAQNVLPPQPSSCGPEPKKITKRSRSTANDKIRS